MSLQAIENKALSRVIIGKSAPIPTEITIRKSQLDHQDIIPDTIREEIHIMANISVNFRHPTDGRTISVNLDNAMTAQEAIQELIDAEFVPRDPQGYLLAIKGGAELLGNQSFANAGVKENDTVNVLPATDAGIRERSI